MDVLTVLVPDETGVAALAAHAELRALAYDLDQPPSAAQRAAPALVIGLPGMDRAVAYLRQLPDLRLVQTLNAGYDNWLGRLPPGVALSNGRGAHGGATAEWVAAQLLAHYRELGVFAAAQADSAWRFRVTESLDGKRVAVIGAGDIATTLRRMLEPFGCRVSLVGRTARDGVLSTTDFMAVRSEQDVVVLAVPTTADTRGMVDDAFLAGLRDGAVVVNAGRGALVDTGALLAHTASGRLRAILDVTEPEPLPPDHPLWTTPGVTITPHVGGATVGLGERAWRVAVEQLLLYARGRTPTNLVIPAS